jgi:hypothetical protein
MSEQLTRRAEIGPEFEKGSELLNRFFILAIPRVGLRQEEAGLNFFLLAAGELLSMLEEFDRHRRIQRKHPERPIGEVGLLHIE